MRYTKIFDFPFVGSRLLKVITKIEGGHMYSMTLREYMKTKRRTDIGLYTYGGCFNGIFNSNVWDNITVGRYCSFSSDTICFRADHPMERVSMSPFFYESAVADRTVKPLSSAPLVIGNDVWTGYGVIITKGCQRIGNGAVIGAGSVVTHDVPSYAVVCGTPARILRYRFSDDEIDAIEKSEWWDLDPKTLMKFYDYIEQPVLWAEKIMEYKRSVQS